MSSINPNNINGQYPIAGQDNDSQGFRDNFTNIKNNFNFAKAEIEDIQASAVLRAPLSGTTAGANFNEMNDSQLKGVQLIRSTETPVSIGLISDPTFNVSWQGGNFQHLTLNVNSTLTFLNWPTSGLYAKLRLQVTCGAANRVLTLSSSGVTYLGLSAIEGVSGNSISLEADQIYLFEFSTFNSGITVTVQDLLRNYDTLLGSTSFTGITVSTTANITGTTASTSTTTGALTVAGGAGVAGNVNVGGAADIDGNVNVGGAAGVAGNLNVSGTAGVDGNLNVGGATGVAGNLNVSGDVVINGNIIQNGVTIQNGILNYNEYQVTVADNGSGTQNVFHLDGTALVSNSGATFGLKFVPGNSYRFDLSDSSNALSPLKFSTTPDTAVPASITPYSTGVTYSIELAGNAGAYTQITITNETPSPLYLYADDADIIFDTSLFGGALPITVGVDALTADNILAGNITVTGNTSVDNITVTGNISVGNITATGNISVDNITATGNISVGNITATELLTVNGALVSAYQYITPLTTSLSNVSPTVSTVIVEPAGTIASANISLPSNTTVSDGHTISFAFGATITTLTLFGNGATVLGGLTTASVTTPAKYIYKTSTNRWYRVG
jgi:hypothetical protein